MILYYDTSALIKLLIPEEGSELAEKLWASAYPTVSSLLAYPEGRSALAMALRTGRLNPQGYKRSIKAFEELHGELVSIGVDEQLVRAAGEYAGSLGLRAYDAVHLATAQDLAEEELVLLTWDNDLGRAAESAGIAVGGASGW